MDSALRRIVIVGGGTAGWMTAAALSRFLAPGTDITLIESDEIGTVGVGEATIPAIRVFNDALGIDEAEFVAATGATFKLGIEFRNWGREGETYHHAFGLLGRGLGLLPFHHYWCRAEALGLAKPLGHYALNKVVAEGNRFAHVTRADDSPLPPLPYAFHFDAGLYAAFLRRFAEARGVTRIEGKLAGAERNGETGDITAVMFGDGRRVEGDLFVDCSGFRGFLIEGELAAGYDDWSHWLPCDRAIAVPSSSTAPLVPYTRATARTAGWQWRIPLQHRTGNGHVFCSSFTSEDEACALLLATLDSEQLADPRTLRFTTGKRRRAFVGNVVAIGLSSGFIEPLESTSIHLIQTGVNRVLDLLSSGPVTDAARDEYNRRFDFEMERLRDFIVLHYHANQREGLPFWDEVRAMPIPDSLKRRIALFEDNGAILRDGDELFDIPGWSQVMIGQNLRPRHAHPIAAQVSEAGLTQFLGSLERAYVADAARLPHHAAYLRNFAPMTNNGARS
ncbi:tryptophan halogenase family protein [Sphingomonas sp. LHG3443-2]|uniref:tryptophan halogenase family protein n=1 Tax=Sphingomonas sp. LHG3443-2 TaxID=2804639 RepID=UPI003CFACCE8